MHQPMTNTIMHGYANVIDHHPLQVIALLFEIDLNGLIIGFPVKRDRFRSRNGLVFLCGNIELNRVGQIADMLLPVPRQRLRHPRFNRYVTGGIGLAKSDHRKQEQAKCPDQENELVG